MVWSSRWSRGRFRNRITEYAKDVFGSGMAELHVAIGFLEPLTRLRSRLVSMTGRVHREWVTDSSCNSLKLRPFENVESRTDFKNALSSGRDSRPQGECTFLNSSVFEKSRSEVRCGHFLRCEGAKRTL